jgi:hypothetical protein
VNNGIFLFGEDATVFASDRRWVVMPKGGSDKRQEFKVPSDMGTQHMANFLECVRTRQQPACPIEEGFRATATVQLGMIAYESNSIVRWDERSEEIVDNSEASKLLKREYRAPYVHPYQG